MIFDSYYWHSVRVRSPELQQARERLASTQDRAAFEQLLRSGDPVAVGIALDHYRHADVSTRLGTANPFERYRDEVIAASRAVLCGPPSPATDDVMEGANYISALGVLMNVAGPCDAGLILGALERVSSSELRLVAAAAASTLLENAPEPDDRLVAALAEIAVDETASRDAREAAVSTVGRTRSQAATRALLRILDVADIQLQAVAALHLLDSDQRTHRARVEEVVRTWPETPPYPADEVLDLLAEGEADR
jgi:hypothetical protein